MQKNKRFDLEEEGDWKLVVAFGGARLVRRSGGGQMALRGGSNEERGAAREWVSLFMHEMVYREE